VVLVLVVMVVVVVVVVLVLVLMQVLEVVILTLQHRIRHKLRGRCVSCRRCSSSPLGNMSVVDTHRLYLLLF
jgi:hypothetical protein